MSGISLILNGPKVILQDDACMGRIREGHFLIQQKRLCEVCLPFVLHDPSSIELSFANHSRFQCEATSIVVRIAGDAKFYESFHC